MLTANFLFEYSFISQFAMATFVVFIALKCLMHGKMKTNYYFFFLFLFIFYNWFNVVSGVSIMPSTSYTMVRALSINFILWIFVYNYILLRDNMQAILRIFINSTLFFSFCVVGLSIHYMFSRRLGLGPGFNYVNRLAMAAAIAFIIVLYNYLTKSQKKSICISEMIWLLSVILLTGSRKGLLMLCVGISVLPYLLYPTKRYRMLLLSFVGILFIYFLIMYVPFLYNIIGIRLEALLKYVFAKEVEGGSIIARQNYVTLGMIYIKESPWRGYGLNTFQFLPGARGIYSHNNYIELLIGGGIIALVLHYISYLIVLVKLFFSSIKGDSLSKLMVAIFISMLSIEYALVSYYYRDIIVVLVIGISYAQLLSSTKKKKYRATDAIHSTKK